MPRIMRCHSNVIRLSEQTQPRLGSFPFVASGGVRLSRAARLHFCPQRIDGMQANTRTKRQQQWIHVCVYSPWFLHFDKDYAAEWKVLPAYAQKHTHTRMTIMQRRIHVNAYFDELQLARHVQMTKQRKLRLNINYSSHGMHLIRLTVAGVHDKFNAIKISLFFLHHMTMV